VIAGIILKPHPTWMGLFSVLDDGFQGIGVAVWDWN
jgi:hypothetical protein